MRCHICEQQTNDYCDKCGKPTCENCIGRITKDSFIFGREFECTKCV